MHVDAPKYPRLWFWLVLLIVATGLGSFVGYRSVAPRFRATAVVHVPAPIATAETWFDPAGYYTGHARSRRTVVHAMRENVWHDLNDGRSEQEFQSCLSAEFKTNLLLIHFDDPNPVIARVGAEAAATTLWRILFDPDERDDAERVKKLRERERLLTRSQSEVVEQVTQIQERYGSKDIQSIVATLPEEKQAEARHAALKLEDLQRRWGEIANDIKAVQQRITFYSNPSRARLETPTAPAVRIDAGPKRARLGAAIGFSTIFLIWLLINWFYMARLRYRRATARHAFPVLPANEHFPSPNSQ